MSKILSFLLVSASVLLTSPGVAQPPGRGLGPDQDFARDREVFHWLLAHHDAVRRQVHEIPGGVETVTESDNPAVTAKIQGHVAAMSRRVEQGRPIRNRDPLFAALFRHYDQISIRVERTEKGVSVRETSDDPGVVRLIRAHAKVVSGFVKFGFEEARKNHDLPPAEVQPASPPGNEPIQ